MNIKLYINGMMCEHCAKRVKKALEGIAGVEKADISLDDKCAYLTADKKIEYSVLADAVKALGFEPVKAE